MLAPPKFYSQRPMTGKLSTRNVEVSDYSRHRRFRNEDFRVSTFPDEYRKSDHPNMKVSIAVLSQGSDDFIDLPTDQNRKLVDQGYIKIT